MGFEALEGFKVVKSEPETRKPKRIYYRPERKKAKPKQKVSRRFSDRGWPETVLCKVCYKRIPFEKSEYRLGGDGAGRGYYICQSHL